MSEIIERIEMELEQQTWYRDYVAEDMDAVESTGSINALEWVLAMLTEEVANV